MNWQSKAFVQAVLSRLPAHQRLYRWLHSTFGQASRTLGDQLERKLMLIQRMRDNDMRIEGKVVLEVGTGWHPVLPLLLYLAGARKTYSLDMNPWLTPTTLRVTIAGIEAELERIADELHVPAGEVRDRFTKVQAAMAIPQATPATILAACGIEYRMPCDASAVELPAGSIDYVLSANVLEHVPKPVIAAIFTEAHRLLASDGLMFHHVNPGDHFAFDPKITTVNFLRYSSSAWFFIGGSGVAYHNRLRCIDYVRLGEDAGFEIIGSNSRTDHRALAQLNAGTLRIHQGFQGYSHEQLACDVIDLFARPRHP